MKINAVQWNIGGGMIRRENSDPISAESYNLADVRYVMEKLKEYRPDIITLQETHADEMSSQAAEIARDLGMEYFVNDRYDQSHIDPSKGLCQSVISRFPLSGHSFLLFFNPHYRKVMENGVEWVSHDKGMTTCKVDVLGRSLTLQTLHFIPFRHFGVDPTTSEAANVVNSIEALIKKGESPYLLQGDFNHEQLSDFPGVIAGLRELGGHIPTTPHGRIYDHVLCRRLQPIDVWVDDSVLTDHFPIVTTLDFET
jgi:endonuclease/exonuclease/phosphatase family metal-dependent hydrolase